MLDIKVTDPTCSSLLARACRQRAYAAEQCAVKNHKHYDRHYDHSRYTLITLAVEVFGATCAELHSFIDALASYRTARSGGTWRKSSIVDWWRRRLSVAVQSATSTAVDLNLRRSRPHTTYSSYSDVWLLHVPPPREQHASAAAASGDARFAHSTQ